MGASVQWGANTACGCKDLGTNDLNELNQRVFDAVKACLDKHQDGASWFTDEDVHDELADPGVSAIAVRQSLEELGAQHPNVVPHQVEGTLTRVEVQSRHMP